MNVIGEFFESQQAEDKGVKALFTALVRLGVVDWDTANECFQFYDLKVTKEALNKALLHELERKY